MSALLTACLTLSLLGASPPVDTVVVCPEAFRPALAPWLALRREQGHECLVVFGQSAEEIRRQIRAVAAAGGLGQILLVGDAPSENQPDGSDTSIPTHYVASQVIYRFGGEKTIAGDNWYADLDDDRLPDVAIGRLPADSASELATMVDKIVAYETRSCSRQLATADQPDCGAGWLRRLYGRRDRGQRQAAVDRRHPRRLCHQRNLWQLAKPVLP